MVAKNLTPRTMTVDDFLAWCEAPEQEGGRYELVRGEVIDMPPAGDQHGTLCSWISHLLWVFVMTRGKGRVNSNDTGLVIRRRADTVRGADIMLFDESTSLQDISQLHVTTTPSLIVEIYSPSDRPGRLSRRIADYHSHGVPLVWVVYPEDHVVDVHRVGHSVEARIIGDTLTGADVLPDLSVDVAEVFRLPGTDTGTTASPK